MFTTDNYMCMHCTIIHVYNINNRVKDTDTLFASNPLFAFSSAARLKPEDTSSDSHEPALSPPSPVLHIAS
jgi:hypothetical protein